MAKKRVYIFFRANGWYPLELGSDAEAVANAECNPGTLRVEDAHGRLIWREPSPFDVTPTHPDGSRA
ncbi:hypothetical protein GCM10008171_33350 [Methylopila jiangsuensis]|uniref:Uncharacterized protein n=1 Tax=Methylopila jiangsuensis TaxID=586230 RepID=A0A9W6JKI5_9HYPH|nr:hypothetical protein [Methylopila jiangsuensis]MDR6284531.1 hypothetical protein [Methylopila jiangsuensis]GLK78081.1 hypothetical protein GCM10008171_33350 [Methylopila jiangsuensis]